MAGKQKINVPLNRVEGDIEIRVEIEDGTVKDAWARDSCSGASRTSWPAGGLWTGW
ncbi:MAG: hypothetical protein AB1896_00600 [Thermodesulfobacteriota bacterium]